MDTEVGAWLRQQRHDRGWSKAEMARRLVQAGRDAGDKSMPGADGMLHNLHRWERDGGPLCQTWVTPGTYESF